ncbi:MAG: hypothetical protein ABFD50_16250, partial [Smithella sp.]
MSGQETPMHRFSYMKEGAVTFMDVLGWKGIWERRDDAGDILTKLIEELRQQSFELIAKEPERYAGLSVEIKSISDTIAMFSIGKAQSVLDLHGQVNQLAICRSIAEEIPLRGATCYGRFTTKGNIMIGPAVDEAASWYEAADWICVILTPFALFNCKDPMDNEIWFNKYPVLTKSYGKIDTHCVNWCKEWETGRDQDLRKELLLNSFLKMGPLT